MTKKAALDLDLLNPTDSEIDEIKEYFKKKHRDEIFKFQPEDFNITIICWISDYPKINMRKHYIDFFGNDMVVVQFDSEKLIDDFCYDRVLSKRILFMKPDVLYGILGIVDESPKMINSLKIKIA